MCGRYTGNDAESEEIWSIYQQTKTCYPDAQLSMGEIFPTNKVPVIGGSKLNPFPAVWGYPGFNGKGVIINARAETAAEKYSFKDSLLNRRCVIPTTGYYEWDANKVKYRFNLPGTRTLYLGGFYKQFPDGIRFVILTTAPNESVADVHNRMPLIIMPDFQKVWINDTGSAMNYLSEKMPALLREA